MKPKEATKKNTEFKIKINKIKLKFGQYLQLDCSM